MVFHHTNFVSETNVWWLRRIRPVIKIHLIYDNVFKNKYKFKIIQIWMISFSLIVGGIGYRYYAWQKIQSTIIFFTSEKIQ